MRDIETYRVATNSERDLHDITQRLADLDLDLDLELERCTDEV